MKSSKIVIATWEWDPEEVQYDVDWPRIHREYGPERIGWITEQDHTNCQLLIEHEPSENKVILLVEFYNPETLAEYMLKWAK